MMTSSAFGRYEIRAEIGRGGMATVYRAHDPRFGRDVAIKVLPREFLHDPRFRARFGREAKAIAALEHPNIVPVYDYGEEDGQPFLVMRYMAGGSLADRVNAGPLPLEEVSRIIDRLAPALDEAHLNGIVHRDLKPGNILFDHRGDPTLSDFGIAKLVEETATLTGSAIIGTPAYMSPEQAVGSRELDSRSDVYSLGVIIFQMLTGRLPYEAEGMVNLIYKHVNEPVPSLRKMAPHLPRSCDKLVAHAMAKRPDDRFPTAQALADALRACAESGAAERIELARKRRPSIDPGALTTLQGTPTTGDAAGRETLVAPGRRPGLSRRRFIVRVTIAVGVIGGGAGLALLVARDQSGTGTPVIAAASATTFHALTSQAASTGQASPGSIAAGTPDRIMGPIGTLTAAAGIAPVRTTGPGLTPSSTLSPTTTATLSTISVSNIHEIAAWRTLDGPAEWVMSMDFSPDGLLLAATSGPYYPPYDEKRILLWSVPDGALLRTLEGHTAIAVSVAFSPDGTRLASGSHDGTIRIWDVASGQQIDALSGHQAGVSSVAWSPDGSKVASGGIDNTVRTWNLDRGNAMQKLIDRSGDLQGNWQVDWSPDGERLASAGPGVYMHVWEAASGSELLRVQIDGTTAYDVAWSPDGKELASRGFAGKVRIWDAANGTKLQELDAGGGFLPDDAWSPDGTLFAATSDSAVILWDTTSWDIAHRIESPGAMSLAWSPDMTILAIGGIDGTVQLWTIGP
jgi:serine/threonine-protein kinase